MNVIDMLHELRLLLIDQLAMDDGGVIVRLDADRDTPIGHLDLRVIFRGVIHNFRLDPDDFANPEGVIEHCMNEIMGGAS